jgi:hypothetical protein
MRELRNGNRLRIPVVVRFAGLKAARHQGIRAPTRSGRGCAVARSLSNRLYGPFVVNSIAMEGCPVSAPGRTNPLLGAVKANA